MVEAFNTLVATFGWADASWVGIVVAVLGILSLVASQLDSVWPDEKQPAWLRPIVKFMARNTGKAANDPAAQ